MQPIHTEADLDALRYAAHAFAVISAWSANGLFRTLAQNGPLPVEELPAEQRAIEITAPILAHLGLLAGDGESWNLSTSGRRLFEAGALGLGSPVECLGDLTLLDDILKSGGPASGPDGESRITDVGIRQGDREGSRHFLEFLYRRSEECSKEVARWARPLLPPDATVLDLGGGHGRYGHELTQLGLRVSLFDLPLCIELARERYGDSLNYISGDFMRDSLGGPYDGIMLSNIIHGLGEEENRRLLKRMHQALRPGGLLILKDMFLDDSGIGPETAVLFGLIMLLYTGNGRSYRVDEIEQLCAEIGFGEMRYIRIRDAGYGILFMRAIED